jgi:hypothetical protein
MSTPKSLIRLRHSRHLWFSRRLWQQRVVFWRGGLATGGAAVLLAVAADDMQVWFRRAIGVSPLSLARDHAGGFRALDLSDAPILPGLAGQRAPAAAP